MATIAVVAVPDHRPVYWPEKILSNNTVILFYQNAKGNYAPDGHTISLFQAANISTFPNESGHYFLDPDSYRTVRQRV